MLFAIIMALFMTIKRPGHEAGVSDCASFPLNRDFVHTMSQDHAHVVRTEITIPTPSSPGNGQDGIGGEVRRTESEHLIHHCLSIFFNLYVLMKLYCSIVCTIN